MMTAREQQSLAVGDRVLTVHPKEESKDWMEDARRNVRWNVTGTIDALSDAHGACFRVKHDGVSAWYEARELVAV
jgi:hypothetical protein